MIVKCAGIKNTLLSQSGNQIGKRFAQRQKLVVTGIHLFDFMLIHTSPMSLWGVRKTV